VTAQTLPRPEAREQPGRLGLGPQAQTAWALVQRDMSVIFNNLPGFLVRTAMQPFLFAFVFAYVLPHIGLGIGGSGRGGGLFASILLPGLMASTLMFQGIQAVALPLVQEFSFSREIEDRVMAPVPVKVVALTKVISGAIQGVIGAIIVIPTVWAASGGAAHQFIGARQDLFDHAVTLVELAQFYIVAYGEAHGQRPGFSLLALCCALRFRQCEQFIVARPGFAERSGRLRLREGLLELAAQRAAQDAIVGMNVVDSMRAVQYHAGQYLRVFNQCVIPSGA